MSHFYFANKGYSSKFRPWRLVYLEKCDSIKECAVREKQLKSAKGRQFLWARVQDKFK